LKFAKFGNNQTEICELFPQIGSVIDEICLVRSMTTEAINHDPGFKRIRKEVIDYLLGEGAKKQTTVTRKLILPDIEPEDLFVRRDSRNRKGPVRRSEVRRVEVEA